MIRRHRGSDRVRVLSLALAALVPAAHAQQGFGLTPSKRPAAKVLKFGTSKSRVEYRQETKTKDFFRPAGRRKGKLSESTVRQRFQVSIWEVPGVDNVLRVETAPLAAGAKVGKQVISSSLADLPISVRYKTPDGKPSSYWGSPLEDMRPTTLIFPERQVKPGDSWTRRVPANDDFELPIDVNFKYLREGRKDGRLCAEIEMQATASGNLPSNRGMATLKISASFLFDIRMGRVLESRSRLFQTMIGRIGEGRPPAKRKIEETTELHASL